MLIYYFKVHPDGLKLEGLFRKSVSIDEENRLLEEISNQNYECLLEVQNPHIIASKFVFNIDLIKRFFSNLKVPILPFDLFKKLMHDQGVKDKLIHLKHVIEKLPDINYLSLMFLLSFLKYDVVKN